MEFVGRFDGVLPCHGVGHEQNFDRIQQRFQLLQLVHQRIVDVQTAGGIDEKHVAAGIDCFAARRSGQIDRKCFLRRSRVDGNLIVAGDDGQLLASGGPVNVHRYHLRTMAVLRQPSREFPGGGGLTGTLQPYDQEDAGRIVGKPQLRFMAAEDLDQFLIDDADNLLRRRKGLQNFLPQRTFFDAFDKLFNDFEIDVGFEQRDADFTERRLHVFGSQASFAAHVFENTLQFVGQIIEHV